MGSDPMTNFVVLGAGAMGRIVVRDLVETAPAGTTVVVADVNERLARDVAGAARRLRRPVRVRAARADASDPAGTAAMLRRVGAFAVVNAVLHHFNLQVMEAALEAGAHYCDLGGLFHYTRRQLTHHREWKAANRLALLGIGAAPGVVNVLARSAADTMDEVREIQVMVGGIDRTIGRDASPLSTSYSIQTVLEEASQPAAVFTNGRMTFAPAMSGAQPIAFAPPVGTQHPSRTIHSEVATLPRSYRAKGIRECSFRIAFPPPLVEQLTFLRSLGLLSADPLKVGRAKVAPREFLLTLLRRMPSSPPWRGVPDEYEILRVYVRGIRGRRRVEDIVECHTAGMPQWKMGIDVDTGCPPSIAMQMLARGEITARGCLPPERAIPVEPFFRQLRRRGMTIRRRTSPWRSR